MQSGLICDIEEQPSFEDGTDRRIVEIYRLKQETDILCERRAWLECQADDENAKMTAITEQHHWDQKTQDEHDAALRRYKKLWDELLNDCRPKIQCLTKKMIELSYTLSIRK